MNDQQRGFAERLALEAAGWEAIGSPFYGELGRRMAHDVEQSGPVWNLLSPTVAAPHEEAQALRLLGGVHRMVLEGRTPDLARHYPSTGGDGDAAAAWPAFAALVADPPPEVLDAMTRPPQTNEVGRSASLVPGFLTVAAATGLPLRLLEFGSSAGLNLRVEGYWYEQGGASWGDPESEVRFVDLWPDSSPPLSVPATIAEVRGCDRDPIDATDANEAVKLLSYVWPDQHERISRLRGALEIAHARPVSIDAMPVEEWLPARLAEPVPGVATVVFHSIVWQYLPETSRATVLDALDAAGRRATPEAPLAYLRLEPNVDTFFPAELRLTMWPGAGGATESQLLATSGFHFGRVIWIG